MFALFFFLIDMMILMMKLMYRLIKWTIIFAIWGIPWFVRGTILLINLIAQLIGLTVAGCIALAHAIKRRRQARAAQRSIVPVTIEATPTANSGQVPTAGTATASSPASISAAVKPSDVVPAPHANVHEHIVLVESPSENDQTSAHVEMIEAVMPSELARPQATVSPLSDLPAAPVDPTNTHESEMGASSGSGNDVQPLTESPQVGVVNWRGRLAARSMTIATVSLCVAVASAVMFCVGLPIRGLNWLAGLGVVPTAGSSDVLAILAIIFSIAAGRELLDLPALRSARRGLAMGIIAFCVPGVALTITGFVTAATQG